MHTENQYSPTSLQWKHLGDDVFVTHFSSGSQIYVKKIEAEQAKYRIFLLHDLCDHHGRFRYFAEWIKKNAPHVSLVMMDFTGHGLSSGTRGHINQFSDLTNDLVYLLKSMQASRQLDEQWYIAGHGLGGLVALDLFGAHQEFAQKVVDGMILSNFILKMPSVVNMIEDNLLALHPELKKTGGKVRPVRSHTGASILTDPADILFYEQDPLIVHRPTLNSFREIRKKVESIYQSSYFLETPMLLLSSNISGMDRFARAVKKRLLCEKKYSNMKHDLYNESERTTVFNDIHNWIKEHER